MKSMVGIIFLTFFLSSLEASTKLINRRYRPSLLKRSLTSQQQQLTRKLSAPNNSVIQLVMLINSFGDACYDYYKAYVKDRTEPVIQCKNCKKKAMTYSEFTRRLIAEAWDKAAGDSSGVQRNMTEAIKIMSEKTDSCAEMINFMIRSSKDLELDCYQCRSITWENV
ncbi:hypothetical protein JST56_06110 [Candidatus Dependentiae bacterium]|jgi:hypothetical protein|nr:hypothetical protein [Candidatus Dependentiae bacterium]